MIRSDKHVQVHGKAYPTRRELMVARELGDQAVVASLCPKQLTAPDGDDYGYRPAVRAITNRLEDELTASCLPRALDSRRRATDPCRASSSRRCPSRAETTRARSSASASRAPSCSRSSAIARRRRKGRPRGCSPSARSRRCGGRGESCRDEDQKQGFCYARERPGAPLRAVAPLHEAHHATSSAPASASSASSSREAPESPTRLDGCQLSWHTFATNRRRMRRDASGTSPAHRSPGAVWHSLMFGEISSKLRPPPAHR